MGAISNTLRKIRKFGFYIPLSNLLLNYGNRLLSEKHKESINAHRNKRIQTFLKPIIDIVSCSSQNSLGEVTESPKIWVCWLQGEKQMPEIVKVCLESIRRNSNGHEVIVLDKMNLNGYVTLPDVVIKLYSEGKIKHAHFADLIRIYLLSKGRFVVRCNYVSS